MKILVITTVKIGYDGLTNHLFSYFRNIDKSDMHIDLVSARGIDKNIIPMLESIGFNSVYRLEYRDSNQIKYLRTLTKLLKKNQYDIIHAHGNSATLAIEMLAGVLGDVKVRIAHSHNTSCKHKVFNAFLKPLFNLCYTDGFACGDEAGRWLFGNNPYTIIPNGKDIDKYDFDLAIRNSYRKKLKLAEDTIVLGNVAAFVEKKNHKFLINVFNELSKNHQKYEMFLFGIDGESLKSVMQQIKDLKLSDKIHYMGTKDNIQDYLQAMDLMLLPSFHEGFPVSVVEWQINGLPCILSNTITQDCNILGNIKFLPIEIGKEKLWVDSIINSSTEISNRTIPEINEIMSKAGFNIKVNAANLKKYYLELYEKRYKIK